MSAANLADTPEINHTASGTNITSSIIDGSVSTNRINTGFHGWISGKQDALTFSTGVTNSGGTIKAALAKGGNIEFVTNANTITISAVVPTGTNSWQIGVDGVAITTPNLADSSEVNPSASGTNVTMSLVDGSISTNRINPTFYAWVLSRGGSSVSVDGDAMSAANLADGSEIAVSKTSTNITHSIVEMSIQTNKLANSTHQWIHDKTLSLHGTAIDEPNITDTTTVEVTTSGSDLSFKVPNDSITYSKLQNVSATNRVLGLGSASPGDATELAVGTGLITTATDLKVNLAAGTGIAFATNSNGITISTSSSSSIQLLGWATFGITAGYALENSSFGGGVDGITLNQASGTQPMEVTLSFDGTYATSYMVTADQVSEDSTSDNDVTYDARWWIKQGGKASDGVTIRASYWDQYGAGATTPTTQQWTFWIWKRE